MITETDILYLSKQHALELDRDDQFQSYFDNGDGAGVDADRVTKLKHLQKV